MRKIYSLRGIAAAVCFSFLFLTTAAPAFAQSGPGLDANTLARLMHENQKNGHPAFYRICEQYNFKVDNSDIAAKYQQQLIGSIKGLDGVISCVVDPASNMVYVKFPKETEKVQGPEHIADIKAIMDTYHLRMTGYTQATYQL